MISNVVPIFFSPQGSYNGTEDNQERGEVQRRRQTGDPRVGEDRHEGSGGATVSIKKKKRTDRIRALLAETIIFHNDSNTIYLWKFFYLYYLLMSTLFSLCLSQLVRQDA